MTFLTLAIRPFPRFFTALLAAAWLMLLSGVPASAQTDPNNTTPAPASAPVSSDGNTVLQTFIGKEATSQNLGSTPTPDQTRRWIMFVLGAPLLVLLLITGALGIALGVYGKPVFLAHMICAGLSITLALAHAVVGLVWFRPF